MRRGPPTGKKRETQSCPRSSQTPRPGKGGRSSPHGPRRPHLCVQRTGWEHTHPNDPGLPWRDSPFPHQQKAQPLLLQRTVLSRVQKSRRGSRDSSETHVRHPNSDPGPTFPPRSNPWGWVPLGTVPAGPSGPFSQVTPQAQAGPSHQPDPEEGGNGEPSARDAASEGASRLQACPG